MNQPVTNSNPSNLHIETSDFLYLLNLIKNEVKTEINCHAIGTIQTFDPLTQTCTVLFNYQKVLKKRNATTPAPNQFSDVVIAYPVLIRVPVMILGGGGWYLTFPITGVIKDSNGNITYPGDTCLLMFCDRDIDGWLESGITTNPPFTTRLHDLSDAVALVGLSPVTKPIKNYNTDEAVLFDSTGNRLTLSGMMVAWPTQTPPSGWLICQGQSVSKKTYPLLFAVIGYMYGGSGDNFTLPPASGYALVGYASGDPNFGTLGAQVGESAHVLTVLEMPAHTHDTGGLGDFYVQSGGSNFGSTTGASYGVVGTTGSTGGGLAHNNVQQSLVINWIIKI